MTKYWKTSTIYKQFVAARATMVPASDQTNTIPFSSFFYKGLTLGKQQNEAGTCTDWKSYTNTALIVPSDSIQFSTVKAAFASIDYATGVVRHENSTCNDVTVTQGIMNAIKYGYIYAGNCDGHTWRAFTCNGARVVCINCKLTCVPTQACTGVAPTSYIVNPCETSCTGRRAAWSLLAFKFTTLDLYPGYIDGLHVRTTNTTITVSANVTSIGRIFCAAYDTSVKLGTLSLARINTEGVAGFILAEGLVEVKMLNMAPDTTYDIYCYTEDYNSHIMPIEVTLAQKITGKTKPPRFVAFTRTVPQMPEYNPSIPSATTFFSFSLSTRSLGGVTVQANIANHACPEALKIGTTQNTKFSALSPKSFRFTRSTSLTATFAVNAYQGCYTISLSPVTDWANETYAGATNEVIVVNSRFFTPAVPLLQAARFSDDGNSLLVVFTSATNRPIFNNQSTFICNNVVSFSASGLALCSWQSPTVLVASLTSFSAQIDSRPQIGDILELSAEVVQAACLSSNPATCVNYPYSQGQMLLIANALNPIVPRVALSSSALISSCDDIVIDPTSSVGNGGRAWSSVLWSVTASSGNDTSTGKVLTDYLNSQQNGVNLFDGTQLAIVPKYYRGTFTGAIYISLKLTNFLGQFSVGTTTVTASSQLAVPRVSIPGPSTVLMYAWQPLSLAALAIIPSCAGSTSQKAITYEWKVYYGSIYRPAIVSLSNDPRVLKLAPNTLQSSAVYTVQVTATGYTATNVNPPKGYYNVQVLTKESGVSAVISGGQTRSYVQTDTMFFDATASQDLDVLSNGGKQVLSFQWSCYMLSPFFGTPCTMFPNGTAITGSTLSLAPGTLPRVGKSVYLVAVRVSNPRGLSATANVSVAVTFNSIPRILMTPTRVNYNPESKIVLTATVYSPVSTSNVVWGSPSLESVGVSVASIASTQAIQRLPMGTTQVSLSLQPYSLLGGASYTFQLSAAYDNTNPNSDKSITSVVVVVNRPPSGGSITVSPNTGDALQTPFLFQALLWTADPEGYPLQYTFAYYTYRSDVQIVVKPSSPLSYSTVTLGQGRLDNKVVTCFVNASDVHGATTMAVLSDKIKVNPLGSLSALRAAADAAFAKAKTFQDPTAISQVLTGVSSAINMVDCVMNIGGSCASINRRDCFATARTCGSCLPGYTGITGDSNSPCGLIPSSSSPRRMSEDEVYPSHHRSLAASIVVLQPGQKCIRGSTSAVCISGSCIQGVCAQAPKTCPNSCSGFGTCLFSDIFGNPLTSCFAQDMFCSATCSCQSTRFGADCSLTTSALTSTQSITSSMCTNLAYLVLNQDVTADVIKTRGALLDAAFNDLNQLSSSAIQTCTQALFDTINKNYDDDDLNLLVGRDDISPSYFSALAKVSAANLPSALAGRLASTFQALYANVQLNMGLGDAPVTFISNNMRVTTSLLTIADLRMNSADFPSPQTAFEAFVGKPASVVQLDASALSSTDGHSLGVTVLQNPVNPTGAVTDSAIITLQLAQFVADTSVGRRMLGTFPSTPFGVTVTLQNYKPVVYKYMPESTITTQCYHTPVGVYSVQETCPDGSTFTLECPGIKAVFNSTCPSHKEVPSCLMWDGSAFSANPLCVAIAHSPTSTTCKCSSPSSSFETNKYRKLLSSGVVEMSFSTATITLSTTLKSLYLPAPPIVVMQLNMVIQPTLWAFVGFCAAILMWMVRTDQREIYQARRTKISDQKKVRTAFLFFENILPFEFVGGDWHNVYLTRLFLEHTWLCMFALYHKERDYRSVKMAVLLSKLICIVFMSTVLARLFFSDDGSCEFIGNEAVCNSVQTALQIRNSCEWHDYNSSCTFKPPVVDGLAVLIYSAVVIIVSVPMAKALETLARSVLIPKQAALQGQNPFPWQRQSRKKSNVVIPVSVPEEKMEEGPRTPQKRRDGDESVDMSLGEMTPPPDADTPPKPKKELWNTFAPDGPTQEYWEQCDEMSDAQKLVTKMLHAARLRKLQEYADFVLPAMEVTMLIALNQQELKTFGRQLLITDPKDKKLIYKSDTVKRARFAIVEEKREKVVEKIEKVRLQSEEIKNELDYIKTDQEKEDYLMRSFALHNLKGYRKRIARRFIFGEGRFESPRDVLFNRTVRLASCIALVALWVVMIVFILQFNLVIGSRASTLWILVTVVSLLEDMFLAQPLGIWFRYSVVNSTVAKDIREIFDALRNRFVFIIQRRAGTMRDANNLIQHFNPACRAARAYPHLPVARLLIAMNDYDVPHFTLDALPLKDKRGADWWLGALRAASDLALDIATRCPAPIQDALYELCITFLCECILLLLFVAGTASAAIGVLLGLSIPAAVGVREWWKDLLRRRKQRKIAAREQKEQEEFVAMEGLHIDTSFSADGTGLKNRSPKKGNKLTAAAMMEKTGKDAYLVDEDLRSGVDNTAVFKSKFRPLRADKAMADAWTGYSSNFSALLAQAASAPPEAPTETQAAPELPPTSPTKKSPTKKPSAKRINPATPAPAPAPAAVREEGSLVASSLAESDSQSFLAPSKVVKGEGGSPENRTDGEAFVLPTLMRYGEGGAFGGVREKPLGLLPPMNVSPDKSARLSMSLQRLEQSITANLEGVIREAVEKNKDKTLREMRKRAKARRSAAKEGAEQAGGESAGPETDDGDAEDKALADQRKSRRRRSKRSSAEEILAQTGPGTARRIVELVVQRGLDLGDGQMLAIAPSSPQRLIPSVASAAYQSPSVGPGSNAPPSPQHASAPITSFKVPPVRKEDSKALDGSNPTLAVQSPGKKPRPVRENLDTKTMFPGWHGFGEK